MGRMRIMGRRGDSVVEWNQETADAAQNKFDEFLTGGGQYHHGVPLIPDQRVPQNMRATATERLKSWCRSAWERWVGNAP